MHRPLRGPGRLRETRNVWSQFIDSWTPSEHAVAVEVCERGVATAADVESVQGVRSSGPLHERRRRRRPGVLNVGELAKFFAYYEIQVACERHKT